MTTSFQWTVQQDGHEVATSGDSFDGLTIVDMPAQPHVTHTIQIGPIPPVLCHFLVITAERYDGVLFGVPGKPPVELARPAVMTLSTAQLFGLDMPEAIVVRNSNAAEVRVRVCVVRTAG